MQAKGIVFKYGDNVDTDVIIPARYLNSSDPAELAKHCMEDIDKDLSTRYRRAISSWQIRTLDAVLPENMPPLPSRRPESAA